MSENQLIAACEATAEATQAALAWVADPKNDPKVGQERGFLERNLRSQAYQARRLARSVGRPMCIGVFGPSQAGKSYLVSVFARKGDTLTALFADPERPEIDFIRDINPYGEKEATGLVTRFSIHKITTPPGYPVALRLLTQTDILKILVNSYFFDADQQEEQALSSAEIDAHITRFEANLAPDYVDVLREEDVWDVEEYFQRQIRRTEAKVFTPFWDRFARAAPRLRLQDRAGLFSILWGRHEQLTTLYLTLIDSLARLGFAEEAFCPLDALVPATKGILNVDTLAGLAATDGALLKVSNSHNSIVELTRAVVAALAAELRIALKDSPWPFFDHTDLLDFPGYRSRTLFNLKKYLHEAKGNALKDLFLRGKVDYLFQRYTAEQELTSMMLCLEPSNLNVTTLPAVIDEWINVTHGRKPEERRGRPILLFFLLTKFDQHLAEKAGDEGTDPALRFQARLDASLLQPFAKVPDSWPLRWTPEDPFKNCFWIRNPNYKSEGVIVYEGRREIRIHDHKVSRIAELREACTRVPEVRAHFQDPVRAFDEVMRLNDGGISYLAENIALVCKSGMKQAQVVARLTDLRTRIVETLTPHFVPTDADKRASERVAVADMIITDFENCVRQQMFGTFLRAMSLDRVLLADALYEARTRGKADAASEQPNEPQPSGRRSGGGLLDRIRDGAKQSASNMPISASARSRSSRTDFLVRSALQVWTQSMHDTGGDEELASALGLRTSSLKEVAAELVATSRRLALENSIQKTLNTVLHSADSAEQAAAKATIVAERQINRFVTGLGANGSHRPIFHDAAGIGAEPVNFQDEFVVRWLSDFDAHMRANALSVDGLVHDPEQNTRLGEIIGRFEVPIPG